MIYTVTLNPSIDFIVHVDHLEIGALNRMKQDFKANWHLLDCPWFCWRIYWSLY